MKAGSGMVAGRKPRPAGFLLLALALALTLTRCAAPEPSPIMTSQVTGSEMASDSSERPTQAPGIDEATEEQAPPACSVCAVAAAGGECRPLWEACQTPEAAPALACITAQKCLDMRSVERAYQCLADCSHTAIESLPAPIDRLVTCAYCSCARESGACGWWVDFFAARLVEGACATPP